MSNGKKPEPVEVIAIEDKLVTQIHHIEDMGHGLRRVVFTTPHPLPTGGIEQQVGARLVIPADALLRMAELINEAATEVVETMLTLVPKNHTANGC